MCCISVYPTEATLWLLNWKMIIGGLITICRIPTHYRTQEINGEKYFIAGGEDHKTGHEENTERCFHALEAHVRKFFKVKEITPMVFTVF